jgi:hypothetical protein
MSKISINLQRCRELSPMVFPSVISVASVVNFPERL